MAFGFKVEEWSVLADALKKHAGDHQVAKVEASPFGMRYVVEGIMDAPDGRFPAVRSVWFVEAGEDWPRFVSAYPRKRSAR